MDREYTLIKLLGIIQQCPAGERISSCPIRKLIDVYSARLAYNYLKALSNTELQELYEVHCNCYNSRADCIVYHYKYELN